MNIQYSPSADAAYIKIMDSPILDSDEVWPGVVFDYDATDKVVGIEFLDMKERTYPQIQSLNLPVSISLSDFERMKGKMLTNIG